MNTTATIRLVDLITEEEIERMARLYMKAEPGTFAQRCSEEIIEPVIGRINKHTGQENCPMYIAYCCEYILEKAQ